MMPAQIAVAGAGLIGKRHVQAMAQAAGARLAAIVDPMPAAADYAAALGVPYFSGLDAMISAGVAGGVILATPNQLHIEGGMACVRAGLPVLVEKPLATDVAAARVLVEAAEAAGVPLATGHHRRHNPLIAAAKAMIAAGEIGAPVSVHSMFWLIKPDDYFDVPWRREPGAGPVFLNLIHDVDLLRHLVGEIIAVQAAQSNAVRGNAVEETCVIAFEFANGALGTANVSDTIPAPWSWELTTGENPAYPQTSEACYLIGGTHGALELPAGKLWHNTGKRSWWEPLSARIGPRPSGDPLVLQIEQFARVISAGEAPLVSGREGLKTLAVIEAVKTAAREGRRVCLQD
ncbi:MAG: oxidoreductase [Alphaproteobacteria bacterium HGW-Alphaproteobacteria-11]|nr:MAG: oxidoreductase [Alphaproteobacteria bacterium HGW-Alphaproteobacteria-11]